MSKVDMHSSFRQNANWSFIPEQEELVNTLRTKSLAANEQYVLGVRVVVGLSCVLCVSKFLV